MTHLKPVLKGNWSSRDIRFYEKLSKHTPPNPELSFTSDKFALNTFHPDKTTLMNQTETKEMTHLKLKHSQQSFCAIRSE